MSYPKEIYTSLVNKLGYNKLPKKSVCGTGLVPEVKEPGV
jgi:hypothetical protein